MCGLAAERTVAHREVRLSEKGSHNHQQHACMLHGRKELACLRAYSVCSPFLTYDHQTKEGIDDKSSSPYDHSHSRTRTMTHQSQAQERLVLVYSITTKSDSLDFSNHHVASTPEGCQISRDVEIGFVVKCGKESKALRHVPTLPVAYAICQQLRPRSPASDVQLSSTKTGSTTFASHGTEDGVLGRTHDLGW